MCPHRHWTGIPSLSIAVMQWQHRLIGWKYQAKWSLHTQKERKCQRLKERESTRGREKNSSRPTTFHWWIKCLILLIESCFNIKFCRSSIKVVQIDRQTDAESQIHSTEIVIPLQNWSDNDDDDDGNYDDDNNDSTKNRWIRSIHSSWDIPFHYPYLISPSLIVFIHRLKAHLIYFRLSL